MPRAMIRSLMSLGMIVNDRVDQNLGAGWLTHVQNIVMDQQKVTAPVEGVLGMVEASYWVVPDSLMFPGLFKQEPKQLYDHS